MPEIFTDNLGNTYELGLTFPANTVLNPGITGSVTNNFPNLTPGVTYEFIVVSYAEAGYTGYAGPITVYVVPQSIETLTNIAEITLNLADKNLLVPTLQSEEIKYGHLLYNAAGAFGPVGSFGINVTGYISSIQSELGLFTSNTAYTNYYGSYPYHLVLDYETNITDFINGDKDPRLSTPTGISCALAIADLNTTLALTKQLSPQSVVYEYSCPTLPFFFLFTPGNACSWSGKSTAVTTAEWEAEKARLLEQQSYKISLFENNTDHIDVNAYPTYSDGNTFAGLNAQAGEAWVLNSVDNSIDAISGRKPVQIFTMFSIPEGSEFTLNTMDFNSLRDFTSLISNTQGLGYFKFKPATQSGAKKLFIWWPAKYISNVAAQNTTGSWATDKYIYEARKVLNNLFSDTKTEITSNVYNKPMDDNAAWQTTTIKDAALIAARKKVVKLARLFRVWAGDYTPLTQDCQTVTDRLSDSTRSLTPYSGGLTFYPANWNLIYNSSDATIISLMQQITGNYNINPSSYGETSYSRAYQYNQIPSAYLDARFATGGSVYGCTQGNFTRDVGAIATTDASVGNYIRSDVVNLCFSYKVIENRLSRGLSAGSSNSTTQAAALTKCNDILTEVNRHVPFQRSGWSNITDCTAEWFNDGNGYLGSNWYIEGVVNCLDILSANLSQTTKNNFKDQLKSEIYGLVENWTDRLPWYTNGSLPGLSGSPGQPNTNQWIEPATGLVNACLYVGDSNLLPAYNLGVSLFAEALFYQNADGSFTEGWGYAMQSGKAMFDTVYCMAVSGDTRLQNPAILPYTVNGWYYMVDCVLPGNAILNAQDCRAQQYPSWSLGSPLPAIASAGFGSSDPDALKNIKYIFPNGISTIYGIQYYEGVKGITAALTMPNYKFYSDHELLTWRTGRDRPIDIQGGCGSSHFALWVKGSNPREGHEHRDQGQISVYCGKRIILMDCGIDYFVDNPALITPIAELQEAKGHNTLQYDALTRSTLPGKPDCPITVTTLGNTGGDITVNIKNGYTATNVASRQIVWNKASGGVSASPLIISIVDTLNKTTNVPQGSELYRFHTGNTSGLTLSGTGNTWTVTWQDVTMSINATIGISLGQTGYNDFTQLVADSSTSIGNPRIHKMLSIYAGITLNAGSTFTMTTGLTVGWSQTEN